ncbi:hypothetical protein Aperf_G00000010985 [Anoplocephala perfoliata]
MLIAVATFRLDRDDEEAESPDFWKMRAFQIWSYDFRSSQQVMTKIQILLLFWILGQLFGECKQVYHYGLRDYFRSYYNIMDWFSACFYLGAFALRIFVEIRVQATQKIFHQQLLYARALLQNATTVIADDGANIFDVKVGADPQSNYVAYRNRLLSNATAYWLRGCRLWWAPDDPEYTSDCLFALANVLSFARVCYLMPAWELLGPLQISLVRMISDIIRFLTLFFVMLIAFVVGLTNLYWYFSRMIISIDVNRGSPTSIATLHYDSAVPAFQSSTATFNTLFWALFGMSSNNVTMVEEELASVYPGHEQLRVNNAAFMISTLGTVLYAIYNACMIIILLNMLIAMMSKSFDEIQGDRLEEWKFARANLWLVYIEQEGILPAPLNLLPSRVALTKIFHRIYKTLLSCRVERSVGHKFTNFVEDEYYQNRDGGTLKSVDPNVIPMSNINSNKSGGFPSRSLIKKKPEDFESHLIQVKCNIMRRYLFQLQKHKEAENKSGDLAMLNIQHQQQQQQELRVTALNSSAVAKDRASMKEGEQEGESSAFAQRSDSVDIREPSKAPAAPNMTTAGRLAKNYTRGLSSLLMPPSVRRKLEAVAGGGQAPSDAQNAEDTARYLLLESTRRGAELSQAASFTSQHLIRPTRGYDPSSFDSQFTARTERPLKHTHLRELYKAEQEMHDMSDDLSSVSFTNSTLSEVDELEVLPHEST